MTTFNEALRNRLDTEFRTRQFTPLDFMDIVHKYDRRHKDVTGTLHKFYKYGLLEIVKSIPNPTGGEPTKMYRVVDGASFEIRTSGMRVKDYRDKIKKHEEKMEICSKRLDNAMKGWVRV